ncbi:MAG: hypothetical protein ACE5FJ_00225 [Gemmatimonadales bacterium]
MFRQRLSSARLLLALGALALSIPAEAQTSRLIGVQGVSVVTGREVRGGGALAEFALSRRLWLRGSLVLGQGETGTAWRVETMVAFYLIPSGARWTPYAAGGFSQMWIPAESEAALALVVGVSAAPDGGGLFVEIGPAGGLRLAAGFRVSVK